MEEKPGSLGRTPNERGNVVCTGKNDHFESFKGDIVEEGGLPV